MAVNAKYKLFDGTNWVQYYFETSASQVGTTATRKFLTSNVKVNNVPFTLGGAGTETANVVISGGDIANGVAAGTYNYIAAGANINATLVALDTAVKQAYDHVPVNVLTTDSDLNATKLVGMIPNSCLPDYLFGQLVYGGSLASNQIATLTTNAKSKLGTTSDTITLTNDTSPITGYIANEGIYYIVGYAQNFAGLDLNIGDWLIATSAGWRKIDNTDAISSWCGLTGVITTAQAKTALGGSIARGDNGFTTGGDVYIALSMKVDAVSGSQLIETTKITSYDNHLANTSNPHSVTKAQVGLGNVDNKSEAMIKSDFTGSIANGNTNFVTGGDVYNALANKLDAQQGLSYSGGFDYEWITGEHTKGILFSTGGGNLGSGYIGYAGDYGFPFLYGYNGVAISSKSNDVDDEYLVRLKTTNITALRDVEFPDKNGTIAMTNDLPSITASNSQPASAKLGDIWLDTSN